MHAFKWSRKTMWRIKHENNYLQCVVNRLVVAEERGGQTNDRTIEVVDLARCQCRIGVASRAWRRPSRRGVVELLPLTARCGDRDLQHLVWASAMAPRWTDDDDAPSGCSGCREHPQLQVSRLEANLACATNVPLDRPVDLLLLICRELSLLLMIWGVRKNYLLMIWSRMERLNLWKDCRLRSGK